jgi:endonuclease/exonuclease/phosphatase family metal-dependent hydrolase
VRVATFNILHGVPLRDLAAASRTGEPELASARPRSEPDAGLDLSVEAHAAEAGMPPTDRHVWSPDVTDPTDLLRAIEELQSGGPIDVIALQEVDRFQPRTGGVDQARIVAEAIGAGFWRFIPSVRGTPGIAAEGAAWVPATEADDLPEDKSEPRTPSRRSADLGPRYGIALISRFPVRQWRVRRFPPAPVSLPLMAPTASGRPKAIRVPDEPRTVVSAIVETPNADVTVATAHLSFVPGVNTKQLGEVRAFLAGKPRPMILLGDFNTPGGIPGFVTGWDQVARVPTYPVARPRVQFDHIMADGWTSEALEQARASVRAVPLPISDHCALVAEFPEP